MIKTKTEDKTGFWTKTEDKTGYLTTTEDYVMKTISTNPFHGLNILPDYRIFRIPNFGTL
jgi:hypothetical protein